MRNLLSVVITSMLLIATQSCSTLDEEDEAPPLIAPGTTFCLSDEQVISRTEGAEAGNIEDMTVLHWHYIGCEVNRELAFYWGKRAADRCDIDMQDTIEQWLHGLRKKSIERIIPAVKSSWKQNCSTGSK